MIAVPTNSLVSFEIKSQHSSMSRLRPPRALYLLASSGTMAPEESESWDTRLCKISSTGVPSLFLDLVQ